MISDFLLRDAYKKAADPAERNNFSGRKILVVDDDVRNVFTLSNAFEKEGILVSVAHNGTRMFGDHEERSRHRSHTYGYHDARYGWLRSHAID